MIRIIITFVNQNILVINLILGYRNMIKLSENVSL